MTAIPTIRFWLIFSLFCASCFASELGAAALGESEIALTVEAGTPLRVVIDDKTPIRVGEPIRAATTHPLFVFDREVLPAGSVVHGRIAEVAVPTGGERAKVYLRGRLRLTKEALVEFDALELADGTRVALSSAVSRGAPATIRLTTRPENQQQDSPAKSAGVASAAKAKVKAAVTENEFVRAFASKPKEHDKSRVSQAAGEVKKSAGGKWRGLRNALLAYWPAGQQNIHAGTKFTAELLEPLDFGRAAIDEEVLEQLGFQPAPDDVVEARLLGPVSSETAEIGSEIRAEITRPMFSADGNLLWPEGSIIVGHVTQVTPARRLGRDGRLRFQFTRIELPSGVGRMVAASLDSAEVDRRSRMELDAEGGAKLKVSKKRFIMPAISVVAVMTGVPGDEDGVPTGSSAQGMTPGFSGFGPWGSLVALSSRAAAAPLGVWGAANSIYFNLLRKADELQFAKHTLLEIRFGRAADGQPGEPSNAQPQETAAPAQDSESRTLIVR